MSAIAFLSYDTVPRVIAKCKERYIILLLRHKIVLKGHLRMLAPEDLCSGYF